MHSNTSNLNPISHQTFLTQIVLLGVCCSPGPGGSGDACEELTLQPLPLYRWATCFADAP